MSWTESEIQNAVTEIQKRAATDADFRALALRDPRQAIAKVNAKPVPDNFKIRFVDNARANLTIVLPDLAAKDGALNEEELELVSGGGKGVNTLSFTAFKY